MAKNLYERKLNNAKNDSDFMAYVVEVFSTDDNGNEHPEMVKFHNRNNKVTFNIEGNDDWRQDDWIVLVCNKCGTHEAVDGFGMSMNWEKQNCDGCGEEFTQIADSKNIEW